jgi:hypothetical protein
MLDGHPRYVEASGLVHQLELWSQFATCTYNNEPVDTFCARYSNLVDRCMTSGVAPSTTIQALHFIHIMHPHFDHWAANKWDQMRRDPTTRLKLAALIQEITDEAKLRNKTATLQVQAMKGPTAPKKSKCQAPREVCTVCEKPYHSAEKCWITHPHLRPKGWTPNTKSDRAPSSLQQTTTDLTTISDSDTDLFAGYYAQFVITNHIQSTINSAIWRADSGASHHFWNDQSLFHEFHWDPLPINTGNGSVISPGHGTIHLQLCCSQGDTKLLKLANVRYTPSSFLNTVSEDILEQNDVSWRSERQQFVHLPTGEEFASVKKVNGLKMLDVTPISPA